ncbi:MAG: hypothetical protein GWN07_15520, partial [Actinobacteria bacterium]|nr:hypothetical protein [Actinomycetota bacterium]NIW28699.1 hypothetical protein [Actinomycetota bacterium]NIX21161.1 hypothetical protein [Actinomycetota bacterium]
MPFLAPDDEAAFFSDLRDMVERGGESMTALTVLQERSQEGDPKLVEWELAPIRDAQGRVRSLIGVLGDARSTTVSRSIQAGMMIDAPSEA